MSRRRRINPFAVILISGGAGTGAHAFFGISNPVFAILFIVAWLLPIPRMVLNDEPPLMPIVQNSLDRQQYGPFFIALLGTLPWIALPWLFRSYPESILWQSLNVPEWLRWTGALLTGILVFTPWIRRRVAPHTRWCGEARQQPVPLALSAVSLVLISANLFVALMAAAGMAAFSFSRWIEASAVSGETSVGMRDVNTGALSGRLESPA